MTGADFISTIIFKPEAQGNKIALSLSHPAMARQTVEALNPGIA
jgi:hypothetical protein